MHVPYSNGRKNEGGHCNSITETTKLKKKMKLENTKIDTIAISEYFFLYLIKKILQPCEIKKKI